MYEYGFVYIWYDSARSKIEQDEKIKRWYIGCHWGSLNDGYICSSKWMRDAKRRRPDDFHRRILSIHFSRLDMFDKEYKILQSINDEEIGKKYYNLSRHGKNHWSSDEYKTKMMSEQKMGFKHSTETLKTISNRVQAFYDNGGQAWNKGIPTPEEHKSKLVGPRGPHKNKRVFHHLEEEHKRNIGNSVRGKTLNLTEEQRQASGARIKSVQHLAAKARRHPIPLDFQDRIKNESLKSLMKDYKLDYRVGLRWIKELEIDYQKKKNQFS